MALVQPSYGGGTTIIQHSSTTTTTTTMNATGGVSRLAQMQQGAEAAATFAHQVMVGGPEGRPRPTACPQASWAAPATTPLYRPTTRSTDSSCCAALTLPPPPPCYSLPPGSPCEKSEAAHSTREETLANTDRNVCFIPCGLGRPSSLVGLSVYAHLARNLKQHIRLEKRHSPTPIEISVRLQPWVCLVLCAAISDPVRMKVGMPEVGEREMIVTGAEQGVQADSHYRSRFEHRSRSRCSLSCSCAVAPIFAFNDLRRLGRVIPSELYRSSKYTLLLRVADIDSCSYQNSGSGYVKADVRGPGRPHSCNRKKLLPSRTYWISTALHSPLKTGNVVKNGGNFTAPTCVGKVTGMRPTKLAHGTLPRDELQSRSYPGRTHHLNGSDNAVAERLLPASHLCEPGSFPGRVTPGFSRMGFVAAGRRVSLGISSFPCPGIPALLNYHRFIPIGSQDLDVRSVARVESSLEATQRVYKLIKPDVRFRELLIRRGPRWFERLVCSPLATANRFQSPAGSLPGFLMRKSCRTMPLVGGFSRRSPVSPALSFRCCSILLSPSSALKTSVLRAAHISSSMQYGKESFLAFAARFSCVLKALQDTAGNWVMHYVGQAAAWRAQIQSLCIWTPASFDSFPPGGEVALCCVFTRVADGTPVTSLSHVQHACNSPIAGTTRTYYTGIVCPTNE
ncbi:hypothetical protein PR048_003626 [Dryococelus australis]|uniref:Uncharacterized protein n=1 Tax=Dryococelus australis TaxID=614101 RepID=A0ABQ9IPK4_9NEOP|nr:hypothetical protein PR048_003626 [Dryococelus australis]